MSTGAVHGLLNTAGLLLNVLSLFHRRSGRRDRGVFLSSTALGLLTLSGWLGGELVYRYEVGTNKSTRPKGPVSWTPVLLESDLREREPRRIQVEGNPVLLYRYNGFIHAMGAVCGHDGGPLEEGKFDGLCVECPWHQTVYDLRDGHVVHGPSTYAEPVYEVQLQDNQIWLRLKQG
jgi:nitrite reductase/ring-hydroxylating ferredoxin subunit